ncbi:response regulator [Syntrophorhabdus aromaticivorans]|uniref:Response regulator n=1 Tax=Syntrophorhabdus aromaticivorans TaxID=328301 RepID=A0A971M6W6_9BACT|nr:response regulator [Syntrophorhabdus aromaticivorans]NLW36276.1 response regulator [Syntrophorhabdus aromaticivorans]
MEKKVLVVDDEASLRRMVAFGLMQRGYETELCENGMRGLQTLEAYKKQNMALDCAVIDIRLPDINGLKLLKTIKLNYPRIPVVIITGHRTEHSAEEAKDADGYLEKPFDMDELAELLEKVPGARAQDAITPRSLSSPAYSAYTLVTLDPAANLMDIYRRLNLAENTVFCDVLRGGEGLMVLVQAESPEKVEAAIEEQIKTVPGVADVATLNVDTPVVADNVADIIASVGKALDPDKAHLFNRFVLGLFDFLDLLRVR